MLLDSKSVKKLYFAFVRINSVKLELSFFIIFMLLALSYGVDGSNEPVVKQKSHTSLFGDTELSCTVNQTKVLICLWNEKTDLNDNYTFDYWYSDEESSAHCPLYLSANHKRMGCEIALRDTFKSCTVKLSTANQSSPIIRELGMLQDLVKMDPPTNLHVENTSSLELLLTWNQTYGSFPGHCMAYQVQHQKNSASNMWTGPQYKIEIHVPGPSGPVLHTITEYIYAFLFKQVKDASSTSFTLPSYDPQQTYTFQVRSQINRYCGNSKFWSEWSQAVTWGRNITVTDEQLSTFMKPFVILVVTILLLVVVVLVIRTDRVWVILVPQIPNPGKKFEELFTVHGNNFQEWLGISKEAVDNLKTNYSEPLCIVTEDPDYSESDGKNPTTNLPTK